MSLEQRNTPRRVLGTLPVTQSLPLPCVLTAPLRTQFPPVLGSRLQLGQCTAWDRPEPETSVHVGIGQQREQDAQELGSVGVGWRGRGWKIQERRRKREERGGKIESNRLDTACKQHFRIWLLSWPIPVDPIL